MLRVSRLMRLAIVVAVAVGAASCVSLKTSRTTSEASIDQVSSSKHGIDAFYKPSGEVSAEATVLITVTSSRKIIENDGFRVEFQGGNRTDKAESQFLVGTTMPIVTAAGSSAGLLSGAAAFGAIGPMFQDDRKIAKDAVNYKLIKQARLAGASAFIDEPIYEWSVREESEYGTVLFFFEWLRSKRYTYRVSATARTATIEYRTQAMAAPASSDDAPASNVAPKGDRAATAPAAPGDRSVATPAPATPAIDIARRGLLDLDAATVRTLKAMIGTEVAVQLTSGETKRGLLGKVDRPGIMVAGAMIPWDSIVAIEAAK